VHISTERYNAKGRWRKGAERKGKRRKEKEGLRIRFNTDEEVRSLPIEVFVVSFWRNSSDAVPKQYKAQLTLIDPKQQIVRVNNYIIDFTHFDTFKSLARFIDIPFTYSGVYRFAVQFEIEREKPGEQ
jgi:hypothetical protein